MNLPEHKRALIEQALDELALAVPAMTPKLAKLYRNAASCVRDIPAGGRRVRSDFDTRRVPAAQVDFMGGA